jgi:dipeptidyl aminopeptidase/acylaminoacyl peptidase
MAAKSRRIAPDDLYALRQLSDCQLSPDGRLLATALQQVNREENKAYSNIFIQPAGGGALRQFTRGEAGDRQPRFSPDGKHLAFVSSRSEKSQLWVMPVDGGEAWQLTKLEGNVGSFAWSPDGKSLAFSHTPSDPEALEREKLAKQGKKGQDAPLVRHITRFRYRLDGMGWFPPGATEIHVVELASGRERTLVADGKDNGEPCWTPDGRHIVFSSNKSADPDVEFTRGDLWKVQADGKGAVEKISTFEGPAFGPAVSPDGQWVAFRGYPDHRLGWAESYDELHVVPLGGGKPKRLGGALDRPHENASINDTWGTPPTNPPLWAADSSAVYSVVTNAGNTEVWRFDVRSGQAEPVFDEPGVVLDFALDEAAGQFYCSFSDVQTPGDLCQRKLAGGPLKRLTDVNRELFAKKDLGQVRETWVKAKDGHRIQGWVFLPPDFDEKQSYPGILYIHGGPHMNYCRAYFHEFQYLAAQGYIVFISNPRGGTGYGLAFKTAIARGWGGPDYDDLMAFTDHVLKEYKCIDRKRIGVAGGSYGGYMANWVIGHTKRFAAAVSDRCVSNFLSFFGSSDFGYIFHKGMGLDSQNPWAERDRFIEMSPMTHLVNAKTPTLVIHQENDLRCPIEQGEQVYVLLKTLGDDTELLRYPNESHGMSRVGRTDRRIHRLEAIRRWFDRYLKN